MKKPLALLVALFLSLTPAMAVTTAKFTLTNTAWTDLGAGPLLLSFNGVGVFAIGDTTPAIPQSEGFTTLPGDSIDISTTSHVWGMARGSAGVSVYVAPTTQ